MNRGKQKLPTVFHKDSNYYQQDWQDYYPTITRLVRQNSYVLEIGCGRAGLSQYLRDNMGCHVVGLDVSEDALAACEAKGIKTIKCDVEDEIPGVCEVIILSAVLERLIDPVRVLCKLRSNLVDNGNIVVGVPNSSHILARLNYLCGKNIKRFGILPPIKTGG